ncbi:MAG: hypothetical protein K9J37_07595 [Saprospiraceae bacterium]|nr:hypothetical protein [Saprospiraceae bacterium]MCF8249760.1 hypothetical protein [Saprospiraceae bacterium]MCF8279245.1 hypothetical protein [Bacteroidales bacterium]MCF8312793.1 hypothetical protein [Saprospiraceae bacterium]MCF8441240.1 hypothetical protein [Saprospiraceae bacterium]
MKSFYTIAALLLFLTVNLNAQFTSGGSLDKPKEEVAKVKTPKDIYKRHNFLLNFRMVKPTGNFGKAPESGNSTWSGTHDGTEGFGGKLGFGFQIAAYGYFNKTDLKTSPRIGFQFQLGGAGIPVDWSSIGFDSESVSPIFLFESGIGPNVTFNLNNAALADVGFLLMPTVGGSPAITDSNAYEDIDSETFFTVQYGLHLGVRGAGLTFGLELMGGKAKYDFYVSKHDKPESFNVAAKLPINSFRLKVGIAL